ncbi:MAG: DUF309 domain-containing protein [Candidatus Poribacteria bacterium]|nr:DUF309 domain-containing protein [Candidatus Poribacteria bacterium]
MPSIHNNKDSAIGITQPVPFNPDIRRYCPNRGFPSYRYVPRLTPHPAKDPDGHSYRKDSEDIICSVYDASAWSENIDYLYGVDLFNFAYWWEAHEAWEGGWASATGDQKLFLQGMIQISAALIKWNVKQFRGMRSLSTSGREKLQKISVENESFMGIDISQFMKRLDLFFSLPHEGNIAVYDVLDISAKPLIFLNMKD